MYKASKQKPSWRLTKVQNVARGMSVFLRGEFRPVLRRDIRGAQIRISLDKNQTQVFYRNQVITATTNQSK